MKTHVNIDAALLIGSLRISIHSNAKNWHRNGYDRHEFSSTYLEKTTITRELGIGWIAVAWISEKPNPNYGQPEIGPFSFPVEPNPLRGKYGAVIKSDGTERPANP